MYRISKEEINRAFSKYSRQNKQKSSAIRTELNSEGGFNKLSADFFQTLKKLTNTSYPEAVIMEDGSKVFTVGDYVVPVGTTIAELAQAGPVVIGDTYQKSFWIHNISIPEIDFEDSVISYHDEDGNVVEGEVVSPIKWKSLLDIIQEKFMVSWTYEQLEIKAIPLSAIPGTYSFEGEFYCWNKDASCSIDLMYFCNYQSDLADEKYGAIQKEYSKDFSSYFVKGE